MRFIKIMFIVLVLAALTKGFEGSGNASHTPNSSIRREMAYLVEEENKDAPVTVMFNEREGIRFEHADYSDNLINYSIAALGRLEEGETNKAKIEQAVLDIYCGKSWAKAREGNVNVVFDLRGQLTGLNDKVTHTKMLFTPHHCVNFERSKKVNAK